jgi:hypothetical protein
MTAAMPLVLGNRGPQLVGQDRLVNHDIHRCGIQEGPHPHRIQRHVFHCTLLLACFGRYSAFGGPGLCAVTGAPRS